MVIISICCAAFVALISTLFSLGKQKGEIEKYKEALKNAEEREEINNEVNKMDNDQLNANLSPWVQQDNNKK